MIQEVLESLLNELQQKHVNLDNSSKILWQLRLYIEYRDEERYHSGNGGYTDTMIDYHNKMNQAKLQLEHYLLENNIQSINIKDI